MKEQTKSVWDLIDGKHVYFVHVRPRDERGRAATKGGVCIAFRYVVDEDDCPIIEYGVSWCSPNDVYWRKHGRSIATERMYSLEHSHRHFYVPGKSGAITALISACCDFPNSKKHPELFEHEFSGGFFRVHIPTPDSLGG